MGELSVRVGTGLANQVEPPPQGERDLIANSHNITTAYSRDIPRPQFPSSSPKSPPLTGDSPGALEIGTAVQVTRAPPSTSEVNKARMFSLTWFKNLLTRVRNHSPSSLQPSKTGTQHTTIESKIDKFRKGKANDQDIAEIKKFFSQHKSEGAKIIRNLIYTGHEDKAVNLLKKMEFKEGSLVHEALSKEFSLIIGQLKGNNKMTEAQKKFILFYVNNEAITQGFGVLRKLERSHPDLFNEISRELNNEAKLKLDRDFENLKQKETAGLALLAQVISKEKVAPLSPDDTKTLNAFFSEGKVAGIKGGDFEKGIEKLAELANDKNYETLFLILNHVSTLNQSFVVESLIAHLEPEVALEVVKYAFSSELENQEKEVFFRKNSIATKLMAQFYSQLFEKSLGNELREFLKLNLPQEKIDLKEQGISSEEKEKREELYKKQVIQLLDGLVRFSELHQKDFPSEILKLHQFLDVEFSKKFAEKGKHYTNATIFLRFINPLLIGNIPLPSFEMTDGQRNAGVALAKPLQNIVNFQTERTIDDPLPPINETEYKTIMPFFWTKEYATKVDSIMNKLRPRST